MYNTDLTLGDIPRLLFGYGLIRTRYKLVPITGTYIELMRMGNTNGGNAVVPNNFSHELVIHLPRMIDIDNLKVLFDFHSYLSFG